MMGQKAITASLKHTHLLLEVEVGAIPVVAIHPLLLEVEVGAIHPLLDSPLTFFLVWLSLVILLLVMAISLLSGDGWVMQYQTNTAW